MRPSRPLRSATSCGLFALLVALGTGLPSHGHPDAMATDGETRVVSADHHAHAAQLVEQDDRVPSAGVQVALPRSVSLEPVPAEGARLEPVTTPLPRARERAPPPGAPRAPPHRI